MTERIFTAINSLLAAKGLLLKEGTVKDATIIEAPSSTTNKDGARDSAMHQTRKDSQWHLGTRAHLGVDSDLDLGLTHTLVTTAANVSDITQAHALLHGDESAAFGDAGNQGVEKGQENQSPSVKWHVALRPSKRRSLPHTKTERLREQRENLKASVRTKAEHPFHAVKNIFGHKRVRYRGMAKNTA